jgi:hypothetical protein
MGAQIPVIPEKPFATCGCRKFQLEPLGDHLNTCTTHSGAKKTHDWMVDQVADLFRTTHKVKTQHVVKSRGQHCGDIEIGGYLINESGPVTLVLDLRITHDRVGSNTDPNLNGHLKYPNNFDQSLNDAAADKVHKYRADYNNRQPREVSFMTDIPDTSDRLHSEFVLLPTSYHRRLLVFPVGTIIKYCLVTFTRCRFRSQLLWYKVVLTPNRPFGQKTNLLSQYHQGFGIVT